ncbi:hypothetical protein RchiOBHm_Chr7g0202181 [Rosa chinensis]|uniref:Uncharacterized protein n=1 Tax=Rosa chinensis TaxID=74649 RepID=A0A2P6P844_ROSCH|nr:hypothetical protein RchiOBHm_Chr7g0202181 [Rosa chinensis]
MDPQIKFRKECQLHQLLYLGQFFGEWKFSDTNTRHNGIASVPWRCLSSRVGRAG